MISENFPIGEVAMSGTVDNLIVEHLRHIRGRVHQIAEAAEIACAIRRAA